MPGNDEAKNRPGHPEVPDRAWVSRRSVLGAAGVGAAGLAAGAFGGLATASAATARRPAARPASGPDHDRDDRDDRDEQVVVHVRAGRGGELDVYHGTSHTRVHDPDLAARLRRAIR
jgi:hypothetical protein